jgi:signal transduction histidine kinase
MRLADFILANVEPILVDWEAFARTVWPGVQTDPRQLRDHAADILRATAWDMQSAQTDTQQSDKSKGDGDGGTGSTRVDGASDIHAVGRVRSGFDLLAVVAEYRALRASVIRLWRGSTPAPDPRDLDDLTRFNESIDQSLTVAVRGYTQRVDQSRQLFLAILAHDLRNPLNAITMSAATLSLTEVPDPESAEIAARITASAMAMGRMIGDLLDFTASGLGAAMPLSPTDADFAGLCQEVIEETRAANPTRTIHFDSHGDLTGHWDAARLRQVVSNLLGNAVQHGDESAPIQMTAQSDASGVQLSIRNPGPPIPADAIPTIFDPLVRGASPDTTKRRRPGSIGLGLYVAREVVAAHGGTINVESSAADGTTFTVHLPRRRRRPS